MKIVTCNVNGIRSAFSKGFFDWYKRQRADVLCLQEYSGNPLHDVSNDGLYLKRNNMIENGEGIVFAENSPFHNIAVLKYIL